MRQKREALKTKQQMGGDRERENENEEKKRGGKGGSILTSRGSKSFNQGPLILLAFLI